MGEETTMRTLLHEHRFAPGQDAMKHAHGAPA